MKPKSEVEDILKELRSAKEGKGVFVQSSDGRTFFLTEKDARRTAVPMKHRKTVATVLKATGGGPVSHPMGCGTVFRWLTSHSPFSVRWRKVSVWWINNC